MPWLTGCQSYHDSTPPPGHPCIEVDENLRFQVDLVEAYDAASNYVYQSQLVPEFQREPPGHTCQGMDGLGPSSSFQFTTGRYSPAYDSGACSYREMQDVTGIGVGAGKYAWAVGGVSGESFAGWTRTARLDGAPVAYSLFVIALQGHPLAQPVQAQVPPVLTVRFTDTCSDVWVAIITEVPP